MSFLEPVIASILGAAVTALAVFLKKNLTARAILKYGPLVQKPTTSSTLFLIRTWEIGTARKLIKLLS